MQSYQNTENVVFTLYCKKEYCVGFNPDNLPKNCSIYGIQISTHILCVIKIRVMKNECLQTNNSISNFDLSQYFRILRTYIPALIEGYEVLINKN